MTPTPLRPVPPRVVLGHDYLTEMGGAERVVDVLMDSYPEAPLLTLAWRPETVDAVFGGRDIRTSSLQALAADKGRAKLVFPLLPLAMRRMPVPDCDVLLISSSGFAHQLRPPRGAAMVWYCHTPPRFLHDPAAYFRGSPALRAALWPVLAVLRRADRAAAARVDIIVANSVHTAGRVRAAYGRTAEVLHPPVRVADFRPTAERSGRLLVISRLLAYKRVDLAVTAAAISGLPLDIVGDGPDRARLERLAGPAVRFLGRLPDGETRALLARAVALVVAGEEDFGLTTVEAQASGRPPVAIAAGGALEIVEDGRTGFLAEAPTAEAFARAIGRAMASDLPADALVAAARRFDVAEFRARMERVVQAAADGRAGAGAGRPEAATPRSVLAAGSDLGAASASEAAEPEADRRPGWSGR